MRLPRLLVGQRKSLFAWLITNAIAQTAITITVAFLIQRVFDDFIKGTVSQPITVLVSIGTALVAMALLTAWLRKKEYGLSEHIGQHYVETIRLRLFDCMQNTAVRTLQRRARGATLLRFVGDLNAIRRWVALGISRIITASIIGVGAMIALLVLQWQFALVAGSIIALGTWLMISQGAKMRSAIQETRRRRSYLATNISEKVATLAVIQVFGRAKRERRRLAKQSDRLKQAVVRQASVTGQLRGISEATIGIATTAVLLIGVYELNAGNCTPGTVVAAMGILGLLRTPISNLARVYEYRQSAIVAREKVVGFLKMPPFTTAEANASPLQVGPGQIEFYDVTVDCGLKNFSAIAEPGKVVAVVGPNGAGKTTLLAATARLLQFDSGKILVDGQDLAEHSLASIHNSMSMLSPDLPLMRGTLEDNLRYRCPNISEFKFQRIIDVCGMDEVIRSLPEGLQTRILEGGSNLSPGQRQRISIARAIMGDPSILLLDEADENLDPISAKVLDRVLKEQPATVLIVTHRLERARMADHIWYLEDGHLIESGPSQELLQKDTRTSRHFYSGLRQVC